MDESTVKNSSGRSLEAQKQIPVVMAAEMVEQLASSTIAPVMMDEIKDDQNLIHSPEKSIPAALEVSNPSAGSMIASVKTEKIDNHLLYSANKNEQALVPVASEISGPSDSSMMSVKTEVDNSLIRSADSNNFMIASETEKITQDNTLIGIPDKSSMLVSLKTEEITEDDTLFRILERGVEIPVPTSVKTQEITEIKSIIHSPVHLHLEMIDPFNKSRFASVKWKKVTENNSSLGIPERDVQTPVPMTARKTTTFLPKKTIDIIKTEYIELDDVYPKKTDTLPKIKAKKGIIMMPSTSFMIDTIKQDVNLEQNTTKKKEALPKMSNAEPIDHKIELGPSTSSMFVSTEKTDTARKSTGSVPKNPSKYTNSMSNPKKEKKTGTYQKKKVDIDVEQAANSFLSDFDPDTSKREMKKMVQKLQSCCDENIYDEDGILITFGKDLCDCLEKECPGCFYPCPKCKSTKCGVESRYLRPYTFDIEYETYDYEKENPFK